MQGELMITSLPLSQSNAACVDSLTNEVADLSFQLKSRLVSTESSQRDLSDHSTRIQEEITRITNEIQSPMIRQVIGTTIKTTVESHLEKIASEQPTLWRAISPTSETADRCPQSLDDSHHGSRRRSPSSPVYKRCEKRRQVRCADRRTTSFKDFFIGRIYVQTNTYHVGSYLSQYHDSVASHYRLERETAFFYHPAQWLVRRGFQFGLNALFMRATQGWTFQIRPFRAIPDDSLIFEFCEKGNLDGVRSLLGRRQASPWDVDSYGLTPLHVSQFLILFSPFHLCRDIVMLTDPNSFSD
jgi:hypothetical protein